jgi:predicted oxidoreductase (fatty acid repression mutant protein)
MDEMIADEFRLIRLAASLPTWSENSTGMLQYIVWAALAAEGMGASLQV